MAKAKFVYDVYIATSPEKIWNAIVNPEITRQYWGHENISDWKKGSSWEHRRADGSDKVVVVGKIIEVTPSKQLVLSWMLPQDINDISKHTQVNIEIEPIESMSRVTVSHNQMEENSDMYRSISAGWPRVLSSMKTLLETGKPLDTWAGIQHKK